MSLRKSGLLATCLCLLCISTFSQTTFDTAGRLTKITISGNQIEAPISPLSELGTVIKEQVRQLLQIKAEEAIRIVKSNNYKRSLHKFYMQLWNGDSLNLLNYLRQIEGALASGTIAAIPGSTASPFNNIFNKHLSDTASTFRWLSFAGNQGLEKKDVFNSFIADYYNETLPGLSGQYIDKADIVEASYYLLQQKADTNRSLLLNQYRSMRQFRKTLYDSLNNYHLNLISTNSPYTKALQLLGNDWFRQWFWVNGGELRINPLDWGVDTLITKKHITDLEKLNAINIDPEQEGVEKRLDSLNEFFFSRKPWVFTVSRLINKVTLPSGSPYTQFSAYPYIKFQNEQQEIKRNLYANETKKVVIHNISAGRRAGLREDSKVIPNRSPFEVGLDSVVSQLGALAKAYGQVVAAPWSAVMNFVTPLRNYTNTSITSRDVARTQGYNDGGDPITIITIKSYKDFTVAGKADEDLLEKLKNILSNDNMLVETQFNNLFGKRSLAFSNASDSASRAVIANLLDQYLVNIKRLMSSAAQQLAVDSFMVAGLVHIYNTASVPLLKPVQCKYDSSYIYYSDTIATSPIDATVEVTIQPYTVKSSSPGDSLVIGKFTYKVGQTKRFTLSAGVAYTLNSYDESIAKAENGTISITNNNQLFRFVVGLNIYFGKGLYSMDNNLGKLCERWYAFAGVGIPKPIENLYIGIGRDIVPGLKLTSGVHIAKHNKYLIQNNQIVEERLRYQLAGPFVSVTIDPTTLISLLNVFKK
jgi:hypothetical protein